MFLSYGGAGERSLFPTGYQAQLKEVFLGNPVGQRAVRMVAGAVGSLKIYAVEGSRDAAALVGRASLLEQTAASLLLHGNAYLQVVEALGAPAELFLLQPDRVSIEMDERGWPRAYLYKAGRKQVRISRHDALERVQLIHIKSLNPAQDQQGLGCLEAASAAASIHNRASRWNKALLDNAARPSGALTYDPPDGAALSAPQFERLREEIERQFSGSGNAGRPMLLEGGLLAVAWAEPDRHGLCGGEGSGGARHCTRVRSSASLAGTTGRHLFQQHAGGGTCSLSTDRPSARRANSRGSVGGASGLGWTRPAGSRYRRDQRACGGSRAAVADGLAGRLHLEGRET
jgi:hypothetical protein